MATTDVKADAEVAKPDESASELGGVDQELVGRLGLETRTNITGDRD